MPSLKPTRFGQRSASLASVSAVQDGVVAVVDDDADLHGGADRLDMGGKAVLLGIGQIGRQQQQAVGAGLLGADRDLARDGGAVAGAGEHGHAALGLLDGDLDHLRDFGRRQREELAGAAGGEQAGNVIAAQPVHVGAVGRLVEGIVRLERRDGEGQEARSDLLGHFLRGHLAHGRCSLNCVLWRTRDKACASMRRCLGDRSMRVQAKAYIDRCGLSINRPSPPRRTIRRRF